MRSFVPIAIFHIIASINIATCEAQQPKFNFMLRGLLIPTFTPMNANGNLNLTIIPAYASYLKNAGADGIVLSDIVGEGPNLSLIEKKRLYDAWILFARHLGLQIVLQIGGCALPDILELAAHAEMLKVDAILVLPTLYYYEPTVEEITSLMQDVSKAAPTVPFLYYDHPKWSHVHVDMPVFFKLALNRIPMFRGILTDFATTLEVLANNVIPNQRLFLYDHIMTTSATPNGYDSFIFYIFNVAPQLYLDIIRTARAGNFGAARSLLLRLISLEKELSAHTHIISALKVATELTTGIRLGNPRHPIPQVDEAERQYIATVLKKYNLNVV